MEAFCVAIGPQGGPRSELPWGDKMLRHQNSFGLDWPGLDWPGLAWTGKNATKITKNIKNDPKQVQVGPFGLILGENAPTGSGKPLECLPGPKTPPGGPGGPRGARPP